jgi:hypothetical protein
MTATSGVPPTTRSQSRRQDKLTIWGAGIWKPKATQPKPAEPTWVPKPESKSESKSETKTESKPSKSASKKVGFTV